MLFPTLMVGRPALQHLLAAADRGRVDGEILNLAAALDRMGGDTQLLEEVGRLFLETTPKLLDQIRRAVAGGNWSGLERAAHTLKGSAQNFGATAAVEAASRLEQMGRAGDRRGIDKALAALETEIQRLEPALVALAKTGGASR
ncbi:MAG: Hpt domain-containing protein [Acidobacteria bacterium]|nr:Hpt domain-containing protein [Acidobacteriota bacterium]